MAVPRVGTRTSGRLGCLSALFILAWFWFLPTGSAFAITSIGGLAQCVPTAITWDIGQSLPPFTLSVSITSNPTDGPLLFTGFEGTSATLTLDLPGRTLVDLTLENSGGVLAQALNLVVQPGTDGCANSAFSGSVTSVANPVANLPSLPADTQTSDSGTSMDATARIVTSSSPGSVSSTAASHPVTSTSSLRHQKHPASSKATPTTTSTLARQPLDASPASTSFSQFSSSPAPSFVSPSPSSLSSVTAGKGLQAGVIAAIVACAVLALALGLWLVFWCKRRRQDRREMRHTRLRSPEPRDASLSGYPVSIVSAPEPRPPYASGIVACQREGQRSPRSANATIGLPSAEAIMEHRNKPLPTPDTPTWKLRTGSSSGFASSSPGAISSSQPVTTSSPAFSPAAPTQTPIPTPTAITMIAGRARGWGLAGRTQGSGGYPSGSVFDDTSSNASTAPPPYDLYYE